MIQTNLYDDNNSIANFSVSSNSQDGSKSILNGVENVVIASAVNLTDDIKSSMSDGMDIVRVPIWSKSDFTIQGLIFFLNLSFFLKKI